MHVQMDPRDNRLATRPIHMGWELSVAQSRNWEFGFLDDPDRLFGYSLVPTLNRTQRGGPEPLLTLLSIFHLTFRGVPLHFPRMYNIAL
jgi:glycosidase